MQKQHYDPAAYLDYARHGVYSDKSPAHPKLAENEQEVADDRAEDQAQTPGSAQGTELGSVIGLEHHGGEGHLYLVHAAYPQALQGHGGKQGEFS